MMFCIDCSNRKVYGERSVLYDLQLPVQDHSRAAVAMHTLQIRTSGAEADGAPTAARHRAREVNPLHSQTQSGMFKMIHLQAAHFF